MLNPFGFVSYIEMSRRFAATAIHVQPFGFGTNLDFMHDPFRRWALIADVWSLRIFVAMASLVVVGLQLAHVLFCDSVSTTPREKLHPNASQLLNDQGRMSCSFPSDLFSFTEQFPNLYIAAITKHYEHNCGGKHGF